MAATFSTTWKALQAQASNVESLIHGIIGESQITSIRLPSDPQLSQLQQCRRVLLRLKWVFDSYKVVLLRPSATPITTFERTSLLRVILHVIQISVSVQEFQEKNLDYPLFRRIALETLLSAVSVYSLSQTPLSFDEDDIVRSRIEELLEKWQRTQQLSELECALQGIIVSVLSAHQEGDLEGSLHSQMRFENDMIFPKLQMTSSDPSIKEHIYKSTLGLLTVIQVDEYTAPFVKAYTAIAEVNGLLFEALQPEVLRKTVLENSLIILRSISETRQLAQPEEEFWTISTILMETLLSGISIMHNIPKEEKLYGNQLTDRLKRVVKAEARDFSIFCLRRQDPLPATQAYSSVPYPQSLQADRIPEYEYDTMYSRPTSSISSTPTCAYDGPQTPYRSRSPMSIHGLISSSIGREGSPDPPGMPALIARNSYRVKRKTIPSPKSPPRSTPGTGHLETESQEPDSTRRSRVGSIDASYTPSLHPYAEADLGHAKNEVRETLGLENLKPSPLHVRTSSNAGSFTSSINSPSHSEIAPSYGGDVRPGVIPGGDLGPLLLPDSKIVDNGGPISPMSPILVSKIGLESLESLRPDALLMDQRIHFPSPVQASVVSNPPTSPLSPPSYSETDLRNRTAATPHGLAPRPFGSVSPSVPVSNDIVVPPLSHTPANGDDCTLELVRHLPNSERTSSEAQYPTGGNIATESLRHVVDVPNVSLKDFESGLEVAAPAAAVPPPTTTHTRPYTHPERPIEPDAISLRPSIRSSNSNGGSRFGFLRRFGGSRNPNVVEAIPSLPDNLQSCFSVCSQSLLLWSKKDSDFIVQMKHPFRTGRKIDLGNSRESYLDSLGQRKGFSIRFVVASSQIVAAYACAHKENRIYIVSPEGRQHSVLLGEGVPLALSIAISPDGKFVAVSCGSSVLIHRIQNSELLRDYQVGTQIDSSSGSIRLQRLNFSTDSKKLVCATQVASRSTDRQTVHIKVWERSGAEWRNGASVEPVPLTMGYGGDLGLTAVFYSDRTELQSPQVFLAASVSKAYPSILSTDITFKSRHLNIPDKRITTTSQCLSSSCENLYAIQSGHHKVSLVDVQTAITKELVDFTKERRNIQLNHEAMAIGIVKEDEVYAFWRSVDDKLVLKKLGGSGIESVDLTMLYTQIRGR